MRESPTALKPADPSEKLANILGSAPFAVTDDIKTDLFLDADGKNHQVIKDALEPLRRRSCRFASRSRTT